MFHRYADRGQHSAIRVGDFKFVKFWKSKQLHLFNLRDDLGETRDLSKAVPEKTQELHGELMTYLRTVGAEVLEQRGLARQP